MIIFFYNPWVVFDVAYQDFVYYQHKCCLTRHSQMKCSRYLKLSSTHFFYDVLPSSIDNCGYQKQQQSYFYQCAQL